VETAALATQAGLAAGANVPEAAAAPEQPVAPQLAAPQPVAPQPAVLHAAEGISPRVDEAPQPPAPAATAIPAGEPERESLVAMRRAPAKPAKSAGKKTKAAAKPAAEPAAEPAAPVPKSENMNWFILKVQSNREDSIREGLLRRVAIAGLDYFFGEVIVPTEKVTEVKQGRKRVTKRKLYPGYLVVQMEINDDTWFLVRETPGIGDFTGAAGAPTPMLPHEVNRILQRSEEKTDQAPKLDIRVHAGDRVKINEGTFENFEGEVDNIDATNGRVTVMINIFGRSTPVELEYWQIEGL
jgi:transcriptional antiterminator NusG